MSKTVSYVGSFTFADELSAVNAPNAAIGAALAFDGANLITLLSDADFVGVDISMELAAADTDIDLTAAPWIQDITDDVNVTGLKLVAYALYADDENAANIVVKPGASDAYVLFITAAEGRTLGPGRQVQSCILNGESIEAAAVDATHKNIRVSGTIGDNLKGILIFGN